MKDIQKTKENKIEMLDELLKKAEIKKEQDEKHNNMIEELKEKNCSNDVKPEEIEELTINIMQDIYNSALNELHDVYKEGNKTKKKKSSKRKSYEKISKNMEALNEVRIFLK